MFTLRYSVRPFYASLCLAAALVGTSQAAPAAPQTDRTTALVKAASDQFELAYRRSPGEAQHRRAQLNAVIAAWRAAPRDSANNELLNIWLRAAIRNSMPGSRAALPQAPTFVVAKVEVRKPERTVTVAKPVVAESKPSATEPTPATNDVKSVAQATSATEAKAAEPAFDPFDQNLDAALLDPFRDDPEDAQPK